VNTPVTFSRRRKAVRLPRERIAFEAGFCELVVLNGRAEGVVSSICGIDKGADGDWNVITL
jgi:hypothetical protein